MVYFTSKAVASSGASDHCRAVRLGQLIANLATPVKGPEVEVAWDGKDEEQLEAAQRELEGFRSRHSARA